MNYERDVLLSPTIIASLAWPRVCCICMAKATVRRRLTKEGLGFRNWSFEIGPGPYCDNHGSWDQGLKWFLAGLMDLLGARHGVEVSWPVSDTLIFRFDNARYAQKFAEKNRGRAFLRADLE